jgi:hypothetical protein
VTRQRAALSELKVVPSSTQEAAPVTLKETVPPLPPSVVRVTGVLAKYFGELLETVSVSEFNRPNLIVLLTDSTDLYFP